MCEASSGAENPVTSRTIQDNDLRVKTDAYQPMSPIGDIVPQTESVEIGDRSRRGTYRLCRMIRRYWRCTGRR